jgi:hypothetical protein
MPFLGPPRYSSYGLAPSAPTAMKHAAALLQPFPRPPVLSGQMCMEEMLKCSGRYTPRDAVLPCSPAGVLRATQGKRVLNREKHPIFYTTNCIPMKARSKSTIWSTCMGNIRILEPDF